MKVGRSLQFLGSTFAMLALSGCLAMAELPSAAGPEPARAAHAAYTEQVDGSLHILHPYLAARLHALERRSPRFQAEMDLLRQSDLLVYLATSDPVRDTARGVVVQWKMPKDRIGEFSAVRDPDSGMTKALVVRVNLPQIVERHSRWRRERASPWERRLSPAALLEEAVDGILIHELWGHLIPFAGGRNDLSYCRDPRPGEEDLASCVMQRENELRRELGMRPRTRYKWNRYARPI